MLDDAYKQKLLRLQQVFGYKNDQGQDKFLKDVNDDDQWYFIIMFHDIFVA